MSATESLKDLLGDTLVGKDASGKMISVPTSDLQGKIVMYYFSAHWCPPCRGFTPVLSKLYQTMRSKGTPMEVVFVSMDRSKAEFEDYFSNNMPWLAVPYDKSSLRNSLSRRHSVMGIPCLVIVGQEGQVLNRNARSAVLRDPAGINFPWEGQEDAAGPGGNVWMLMLLIICLGLYWYFSKH